MSSERADFSQRGLTRHESPLSEELRRFEGEILRAILEMAPDPISLIRLSDRVVVEVNKAFLELSECNRREIVGRPWRDVGPLADPTERARFFKALDDEGEVRGFPIECGTKTGRRLPMEVSARPLRLEGETLLLLICRDVTGPQRLWEQLRQSQKMEAVGLLAGGVAHDFNNILTSMTMASELALRELPGESPEAAAFRQILELAERASDLTRQLLTFSRNQPLRSVPVGVNRLIENLLKMIRRLIGEDIELHVSAAAAPDWVLADPGQIEQVLTNLAVNARDAMPAGGHLFIRTGIESLKADSPGPPGEVVPGRYVVIDVTDTGCGMGRETAERAFDPFFTTKEKGKGTGLGLSIVYGIVRGHQGFIAVDSIPGEGTTFRIWLPLCERSGSTADEPAESKTSPNGHETLLLVEDEDSLRRLITRMLETRGYRVLQAAHPAEALELFRKADGRIDLLVTDIVMPGSTGTDLFRRLRELKADLRVLYVSGYTDREVLHREVLEPGMPFLPKPFRMEELAARIRSLLDDR